MNRIRQTYKNAYSGLSRATWWLSLVMLINRSGTMVVPFMTLYLTEKMHYSMGHAGFVMSMFGAGAICGALIGGRLTDKIGFYSIQISALIGGGILFIILGQMENYVAICVLTFVLSLVNESFRPANSTAIAHYSKEGNVTRSYSLNRLAINMGWAAGGALGGFVAARNYHLLFWIDGLTNLGAAILLRLVLSPTKNMATPSRHVVREPGERYAPYKDKGYIGFIVLSVLFCCCFYQMLTTQPVYFKQYLHLSEPTIGLIMAANGILIALFEMVLVFKLEGKRNPLHFASIGVVLMGVSFVIFNMFTGTLWLAVVSMLIVTAGEMLSMPFMNTFWVSRTKSTNRGQYAALYTIAWSIGQIVGPYLGSITAQHLGFATLWWIVGALSLAAAIGYKILDAVLQRNQ